VVADLVEGAGDEVGGGVRRTGRAGAHAGSWGLGGVRVGGGRHGELVVVGLLDRFADALGIFFIVGGPQ